MYVEMVKRIQAFYRMKMGMKYLNTIRAIRNHICFIQNWMRVTCRYKKTKLIILDMLERQEKRFEDLTKTFKEKWPVIKQNSRLEIHINSLGYDRFKVSTTNNFIARQN